MTPVQPATVRDPDADHETRERRLFSRAALLGFLLFLALFALSPLGPIFRLFSVPAASMAPGLQVGSFIIASRTAYGYSRYSFDLFNLPLHGRWASLAPKRGDVIVFRLPRDLRTTYVKRVIGLPGDRVEMKDGRLWLNGQIVQRETAGTLPDPTGVKGQVPAYVETLPGASPYKIVETDGDTGFLDNAGPFIVPAASYFVLGDNRDNSTDSRIAADKKGVGYIPEEFILGRVVASF